MYQIVIVFFLKNEGSQQRTIYLTALQSILMGEFRNKLTASEKEELQGFYDSDDPNQHENEALSVKLKN